MSIWRRELSVRAAFIMVLLSLNASAFAADAFKIGASSSPPSLVELAMYAGRDNGLFREEGLDVSIVAFTGDPTAQRALIAGEVDAVNTNLSTTITSVASGATVKAIAAQVTKLTYLFIAQKEVKSLADLAGKTIAVSAPGALSYHVPRIILQKYGVNPDSATYLAVGSDTQRFQSLVAKRADASILHVIRAIEARNNPQFHSIADVSAELPDLVQFYLAVTDKSLAERPDVLRRFLRAHIKATRWVIDNKAGAVRTAMKLIPNVSEDVMGQGYDLLLRSGSWDPDMAIDDKAVQATHDLLVSTKVIQTPIALERAVDRRIVAKALDELGRRR